MEKKLFVMSKIYDLSTKTVSEIKDAVQKDLDIYSGGGIRFELKEVSGRTLEITFERKYKDGEIDWLNYDPKMIYNVDTNIITGHGYNGFRIPVYWGSVPYGYPYFMPKKEFIRCYKESAVLLGIDKPKNVKVTVSEDRIVMEMKF